MPSVLHDTSRCADPQQAVVDTVESVDKHLLPTRPLGLLSKSGQSPREGRGGAPFES